MKHQEFSVSKANIIFLARSKKIIKIYKQDFFSCQVVKLLVPIPLKKTGKNLLFVVHDENNKPVFKK
jgi:hypothetical protein